MQDIGFDVISDLHLSPNDSFNWENKATSLYCIVAGNISSDLRTIKQTLLHLTRCYQGVFYIPGMLEYQNCSNIPARIIELIDLVSYIPNACLLHQHVAVIDGVAIVGINRWSAAGSSNSFEGVIEGIARKEDFLYLRNSLSKLQRHLDVKKIIIVSGAVPHPDLYFKENPDYIEDQVPLSDVLDIDTEKKTVTWVFGTYDKLVDTTIDGINYINNPRPSKTPYWAKRLTISV